MSSEKKKRTSVDYSQVQVKPMVKCNVLIHNIKVYSGKAHNTIRVSCDARESLTTIVEDRVQKIVKEITHDLMSRCAEKHTKTVTRDMLTDMLIIAKYSEEEIAKATATLKSMNLYTQANLKRLLESGKLDIV